MNLSNKRNSYGVKSSCDCYRHIKIKNKKVLFTHLTSDSSLFEKEKQNAKSLGLKTRTINGELFIEHK